MFGEEPCAAPRSREARSRSRALSRQCVTASCLCLLAAWGESGRAQLPDDWEVLRIYVPANQVGELVPRDYNPIEIEDLSEGLRREAQRRSARLVGPHIADATYVARFTADNLNSDQSRWTVKTQVATGTLALDEFSVGLHNSLATPLDDKPLLPNLRFSVEGKSTLARIPGDTNYWFGWSASPILKSSSQAVYELRLPAATLARMLIAAPEEFDLSSPDVVVSKVESPRDYVSEEWPELNHVDGHNWYLIHFSGKSRFRLVATTAENNNDLTFQQFVRRSLLAYKASSTGLILNADLELERINPTQPVRIAIAQSLRVRSVTVDGALVSYEISKTTGAEQFGIELPSTVFSSSHARIRIEAIADTELPFNEVLPKLEVEKGYTWEGRLTLAAEDALSVEQMIVAEPMTALKAKLENTTVGKRWTVDWLGVLPSVRADISRPHQRWEANSLTRLAVQQDWIAANTILRMNCKQLASNEVRLKIGEGWLIDDLTVGRSSLPINLQLPDGEAGEVILTWDRLIDEMSIDLQLVAHLPTDTDTDQFTLQAPAVVTVNESKQEDRYAFETSGRFQIQPDAKLQRLQLRDQDLAPWQAELNSKQNATQLYRGAADKVPPLILRRSSGTYSAKLRTIATSNNSLLKVEYAIEIVPTTGAINGATFLLNLASGVTPPVWRVTQSIGGEEVAIVKALVSANRDSPTQVGARGETRFEVQLAEAVQGKFVVHGELQLPWSGSTVELPLVNTALASDTWLILPRSLALPSSTMGLITLPSSICCETNELSEMLREEAESMVAYRYDPSLVASVELRATQRSNDGRAWMWSDTTAHWLYRDGRAAHQTDFQIFAAEAMTLSVELPSGWVLNRLLIDGEVMASGQPLNSRQVPIAIPRGELVRLSLRASSQFEVPGWFANVEFPQPTCSLVSLSSTQSLYMHQGGMSLDEVFIDSANSRIERLNPINWWRWLSPTPREQHDGTVGFAESSLVGDRLEWRKIELPSSTAFEKLQTRSPDLISSGLTSAYGPRNSQDREATAKIAIVDRSALCALCIALLLVGSACSFVLLKDRAAWWWLAVTLASVAVLLVTTAYVGIAQLALLCLACGGFARLVRVLTGLPLGRDGHPGRRGSTVVRASVTAPLLLLALSNCPCVLAQETPANLAKEKAPVVYGVLIPLTENGELSAKHVYAPRKLMNLLNSSGADVKADEQPQILAAKYMLKLRRGTSLTSSFVQEFTVEFDLMFNSTEFPLSLPFKASQLQLLRGSVAGQEVYIGSGLQQTADAITYLPLEAGRVRLRLQLIRATTETTDQIGIAVAIPKIAASTLEVVADDALEIEIAAMGAVRRLTAASWSAELGPAETLRVSWPARSPRAPMPNQVQAQADTWLHSSEGQIVADCQLRVTGAGGLPKQLHLVLDSSWEPVGSNWNEVRLQSSEVSAVGYRRIYTVVRESLSDRATIRVLVVPRLSDSATTLTVPFFSLQEGVLNSRTLAISNASRSRWKLTGNEAWTRITGNATELNWEANKPARSELWRLPTGSTNGSLQRLPLPTRPAVDEFCELQLLDSMTVLNYRVNWLQPSDEQSLKFEIPSGAEPRAVTLNGLTAEYQLCEHNTRSYLLIQVARSLADIRSVEIDLQLNTHTNNPAPLPRILLQDVPISSSRYQVNCDAESICTLTSAPKPAGDNASNDANDKAGDLVFERTIDDTTMMLSTMTTPVGAADLDNDFRASVYLPTLYRVQPREPANLIVNVMALSRSEQGWRATVEVVSTSAEGVPFALFDIPTAIRDLIEPSGSPYRISAAGAAGRSTLCLLPSEGKGHAYRASFTFRLPTPSSSQSLTLPEIYFVNKVPMAPVLALPKSIDDQPVRWSRAGRRLADDWLSQSGLELANQAYQYFEVGDNLQQITWRPAEVASKAAEILFAWIAIDRDSAGDFVAAVNYWIDSNNHLDIAMDRLPESRLIGIQSGATGAVWHRESSDRIRVLMQPSYLPVHLKVYLKWPSTAHRVAGKESFQLALPVLNAVGPTQIPIAVLQNCNLTSLDSLLGGSEVSELEVRRGVAFSRFPSEIANRWKKLLVKSLPVVSSLSQDELASWVRNWSPSALALNVLQDVESSGVANSDFDESKNDTVEGFWNWYLNQLNEFKPAEQSQLPPAAQVDFRPSPAAQIVFGSATLLNAHDLQADWYLVDAAAEATAESNNATLHLSLNFDRQTRSATPMAIVVILLLSASAAGYLVVQKFRLRVHEVLSVHPWLYWTLLAAMSWLLLPVAWPSGVIALSAVGLLAAELFASRRRMLAMKR